MSKETKILFFLERAAVFAAVVTALAFAHLWLSAPLQEPPAAAPVASSPSSAAPPASATASGPPAPASASHVPVNEEETEEYWCEEE